MLHFDGHVISSPPKIQDLNVHYYEDLLSEPASWRPRLDGLAFDSLHLFSVSWLERHFDEDEVFQVVSDMAKDELWREVIDRKFGYVWGGCCFNVVRRSYGVGGFGSLLGRARITSQVFEVC